MEGLLHERILHERMTASKNALIRTKRYELLLHSEFSFHENLQSYVVLNIVLTVVLSIYFK